MLKLIDMFFYVNMFTYISTIKLKQTKIMKLQKRVTTKKEYAGEYKVYIYGEFAGNITTNGNDRGEWVCFDKDNEWLATTDTKWEALTNY